MEFEPALAANYAGPLEVQRHLEQREFFHQMVLQTVALPLTDLGLTWAAQNPHAKDNPCLEAIRASEVMKRALSLEDSAAARMELLVIKQVGTSFRISTLHDCCAIFF